MTHDLPVVERLAAEREEEERRRLEDMSEDEYDALTDADKSVVDRKRLEIKKERIRKYVHANPWTRTFNPWAIFIKHRREKLKLRKNFGTASKQNQRTFHILKIMVGSRSCRFCKSLFFFK